MARTTGERTVAFIGDSTFFHSGLPALANAVKSDDPVTVIILNNYVTAMTGFQPSVVAGGSGQASEGLSLEDAVRGLGVREVHSVDQFETDTALEALKKARDGQGLNVVICNAPCVVNETRLGVHEKGEPYAIDPDLCNACSLCVRVLGCPAIHVEEERYIIDRNLCDGCGLCAEVCNQEAIRRDDEHE